MKRSLFIRTITQDPARIQPWTLPETASGWYAYPSQLETLASNFAPISLKQMDDVALLNRTDTKFVMTQPRLLDILAKLQPHYQLLTIDGRRLNHYRTLYFDTPNFDLYNLHVNERAERYKVRSREYVDSQQSYLEVKHRTRKDRTIKTRLATDRPVVEMTLDAEHWLQHVFPFETRQLQPSLWNSFTRITLVNRALCERVTLDVDLAFYTADRAARLDGLVIAEAKMNAGFETSPFLAQMRSQRIPPQGFSKYCMGVAMLYENVKKNGIKAKMIKINKLTRGVVINE